MRDLLDSFERIREKLDHAIAMVDKIHAQVRRANRDLFIGGGLIIVLIVASVLWFAKAVTQ